MSTLLYVTQNSSIMLMHHNFYLNWYSEGWTITNLVKQTLQVLFILLVTHKITSKIRQSVDHLKRLHKVLMTILSTIQQGSVYETSSEALHNLVGFLESPLSEKQKQKCKLAFLVWFFFPLQITLSLSKFCCRVLQLSSILFNFSLAFSKDKRDN